MESFTMTNDEFLTVNEAAQFLKTTPKYIRKLAFERRLPVYRPLGGRLFFKRSELEKLFENSRQATKEELQDRASALLNKEATR
jgi:excisionase family DNA binding protein